MPDPDPYPPAELLDYVSGVSDPAVARAVGEMYRDILVRHGGLAPGARVLDVGCGTGRIALALTGAVGPTGTYDGFDISPAAVAWCRENITPRHPNFRFRVADVYNEFYNPAGRTRARRYQFPYPAGAFDLVFLTSVFTHLLPHDLAHYVSQIGRVLKPGGRCVATFFLHDAETAGLIRAGRSAFRLPHRYGRPPRPSGTDPAYGDCLTESAAEVERVVAYEAAWVRDRFAATGLPVHTHLPGHWSGRPGPGFQDVLVATKTGTESPRLRAARALRAEWLREWVWRARLALSRRALPAGR